MLPEPIPRFRIAAESGDDGGRVLRVAGPLDRHTVDQLATAIDELSSTPGVGLTVDLGDVSFCDSPALRRLEDHIGSLRQRGVVVAVQHPSPSVVRIMDAEDAVRESP